MPMLKSGVAAAALLLATSASAFAQNAISANDREAAIASIAEAISDEFYDAAEAERIASDLLNASESGEFSDVSDADRLANLLTERLRGEDRHFSVRYVGPQAVEEAMARSEGAGSDGPPRERPADPFAGLRRANFGFAEVEILPGNIGYIKLDMFAPIAPAEATARAALNFVANTDAVIFDLRDNGGGSPSMVQYLTSHFLRPGGRTLINTFVSRDYEYPNQMWSLPSHPAGHRPDTPLYVLTSSGTGSAGEGFPYHLKAMERATIVGQSTYGAGNPGDTFLVEEGYSIFISTGSARNPITQANWEGTGVTPDIDVPADEALDRALIEAYRSLLDTAEDPNQQRELNWAIEAYEAQQNPVSLSAGELERYVGDFGIRDAYMEDGQLFYRREGNDPILLIPLGEDRFMFADDASYRVVFRFDRRGRLEAMDLHLADGRTAVNPLAG